MFKWLSHKIQHFLITLRVSILSTFIILFILAIGIVTVVTYVGFSKSIEKVSFQFMREVSATVFNGVISEINDVAIESQFSANLINRGILNPNDKEALIHYTYDLMRIQTKTLPSVQSAYWGDEHGDYVLASKLDDNTFASDVGNKSKNNVREVIYRNREGTENRTNTLLGNDYDPRARPWYVQAKNATHFTWTDVYRYHSGLLGMTAASPVFKNNKLVGVFGLDVRLDYLRHFLEGIKVTPNGVVYVVSKTGHIISVPGFEQYEHNQLLYIDQSEFAWLKKSFDYYEKTKEREFVYNFNGQKYLAVYSPLPIDTPHVWYVGVVIPEKDFISELIKTNLVVLVLAIVILIAGIASMSMLVTRIVNPLRKVVTEANSIKHFNLAETASIRSHITEIYYLADAIRAMKKGLRSFKKYVPAGLVRHLIETGQDSAIGGEKKNLAIFFSDIKSFTQIAQDLDPNHLMELICDYFNQLTQLIILEQGTIDKYIGDSIMAFWGAPSVVIEPCQSAARAALNCQKQITKNHLFETRIGLHFGEVVVGNMGSSERLSYTAIGDAINLASRLESINKIYGTKILVSDVFYEIIKNEFVLRKIDHVLIKGKNRSMFIYELLAKDAHTLTFDLQAYEQIFAQGFALYQKQQFKEAIAFFQKCISLYPEDRVAPHFIQRSEYLIQYPKNSDWDGVWHLTEK